MKKDSTPKDQLTKRLAGYAAAAGAMMLIGANADGQVVYSGLVDTLVDNSNPTFSLDMNNDDVTDFQFSFGSFSSSANSFWKGAYIGNTRTGSYANSFAYGDRYDPTPFDVGAVIDSNIPYWTNSEYSTLASSHKIHSYYNSTWHSFSGSDGNFRGIGPKYLGVRFHIGTDMHYGWIRAEVDNAISQIRIYDWAYENTPGTGITTGEGIPTAIVNTKLSGISYFPNPVIKTLQLKADKPTTFTLLTIDGKELLKKANITQGEMNMESFASGMYMLKVEQGSKTLNQKIVKK